MATTQKRSYEVSPSIPTQCEYLLAEHQKGSINQRLRALFPDSRSTGYQAAAKTTSAADYSERRGNGNSLPAIQTPA